MNKILWKSLLVSPAVLGTALVVSGTALATETGLSSEAATIQPTKDTEIASEQPGIIEFQQPKQISLNQKEQIVSEPAETPTLAAVPAAQEKASERPLEIAKTPIQQAQTAAPTAPSSSVSSSLLNQIKRYSNEGSANSTTVAQRGGRVTQVSQLSDVQPTDWAFSALQNLVERYNCIAGYPDGTFRGNRALTRYEFAAGLNACLEAITQLIGPNVDFSRFVTKEDLAVIQRLLEEFQAELATLRGRVDALEARAAELEANQFSTTTKLVGEAIFAGTDSFGETDDVPAFQQRVRLNLNTSFTGRDLLITRMQMGNATPLSVLGTSREGAQTFNVIDKDDNIVRLDTLQYFFPFSNNIDLVISANRGTWDDFTPTLNPYMEDFDGGNGSLSTFGQRNPIYRLGGGQGIGANIKFGRSNFFNVLKPSSLTIGYLANEGSSPKPSDGIFNGNYAALAQLNFTIGGVSMAATYIRSYFGPGDFGFDNGREIDGLVGTNVANTLAGINNPVSVNSYGLQASLQPSRRFGISGWIGYSDVKLEKGTIPRESASIWTYAITLAFPDLFKEGNLGGIVVGAQPYLTQFKGGGVNIDGEDIPWHIEGFYKWQLTDNISITPGVIWLINPNQNGPGGDDDNPSTVIGTIRGTFSF
ncbi:MAG: iron uptake porin [Oscillatoriaceae bacterium SKW80]|nr:iron uptake porin [Oscillatoriaceae bacterium SKYG93]MCX8122337.1 iron uptake porin [Oscillatoriaceae bacterium SKW80]MDW8452445.1 iron uptake porin [Oscillatoriaceae cyanobacterium SKYGB_i_bin93]HIK27724.1 iron uptake porin [Oscillatoriaceae cyanobacterium M7585_C2015_266]